MSGPRGTVLLVDDEEKILKRLGRALRDDGHDVVEAGSGREAQRQLAQRPFDLFVVDNVMPGINGLELLRDVFTSIPEVERPQVVIQEWVGRALTTHVPYNPVPRVSAASIR